jgi:hypothetical protein
MKKRNLAVMAALAAVCLWVKLTPPLRDYTSLVWGNWNSQTARHNYYYFYFSKRQWLADARTMLAGFRFLLLSVTASPTNPMAAVNIPPSPPIQLGISTNLLGIVETGSLLRGAGHRLSQAGRIIGPDWLSSFDGRPPIFAFTEYPSNGFYGLQSPGSDVMSYIPVEQTSWARRMPHRTDMTPPRLDSDARRIPPT